MFENPRRGRQARNFTTNAPKILDLKSSSEQIFSRKLPLGAPVFFVFFYSWCDVCKRFYQLSKCRCRRDDRMFVVEVYCKMHGLSSRLAAPGSPRMKKTEPVQISELPPIYCSLRIQAEKNLQSITANGLTVKQEDA